MEASLLSPLPEANVPARLSAESVCLRTEWVEAGLSRGSRPRKAADSRK